jgi:peptide/nickel transport system substrate-binding protein
VPVATMLTSMHFGFDPSLKPMKQDPARVKKLLAEAGMPNGFEMTLHGPQGRYVRDKEVLEAVGGQLTKAGIKATVRTYEFVNYLNNMVYVHKAGPVWLIGWGTPTIDAETVYVPLFRSGNVLANYHNEDFNRMVDEAQTIMDDKKRRDQYLRINKLLIEDAAVAPLYQQIDLYGATKRLHWKARSDERLKAYDMSLKESQ